MAGSVTIDDSVASTTGLGDEDRSVSGDSLSEWRSYEQFDNGSPSTSPPFWDTDGEDDDPGCCFACESNKKKVVHPYYDEYLGGREFRVDEVDCDGDFPTPVDVDYIFFDAVRDRAFANYLGGIGNNLA